MADSTTSSHPPPAPPSSSESAPPATSTSVLHDDNGGDDAKHNHSDSDTDSLSGLSSTSDPALAALQSARIAELRALATSSSSPHQSSTAHSSSLSSSPFSTLQTYSSEKAAMQAIAGHARSALLFTHASFPVCADMGRHLGRAAAACARTAAASGVMDEGGTRGTRGNGGDGDDAENVLFLALDAEAAPFLTDRLRVRVLPCVVGYVAGEEVGRLVGFDGLGKRGRTEAGWTRVVQVLRSWGVVGRGRLIGEEQDEDDEESEDENDLGGGREDDGGARRDEKGSWIGKGRRSNVAVARNGIGRTAGNDDDDDDWD